MELFYSVNYRLRPSDFRPKNDRKRQKNIGVRNNVERSFTKHWK